MSSDTTYPDITTKYSGIVSDKIIQNAIKDNEINGYMTVESINKYIKNNTHKSEFEFGDGLQLSVPDFIYIDMRVNYNLFIVKNTFHTHETLIQLHPFEQFGKIPEDILTQQVIVMM